MKPFLLALGLVALAVQATAAEPIHLTCTQIATPGLDVEKLWVPLPVSEEQFWKDVNASPELGRLFLPRPQVVRYVINSETHTISSPGREAEFKRAKVTDLAISARADQRGFELDRTTGTLEISVTNRPEAIANWNAKHGGRFPATVTWQYRCVRGQGGSMTAPRKARDRSLSPSSLPASSRRPARP